MTGVQIRVGIEDKAARQALDQLLAAGEDLTPAMDAIGAALALSTDERFELERGPGGSPWPPSIRVLVSGGKTLSESGRLGDSITHEVSSNSVRVGTNVGYAATHQFGNTIRARSAKGLRFRIPGIGWVTKQSVTIPARPFLGIDDDDEGRIADELIDYLRDAAGPGAV